jgi:hypothetical protein
LSTEADRRNLATAVEVEHEDEMSCCFGYCFDRVPGCFCHALSAVVARRNQATAEEAAQAEMLVARVVLRVMSRLLGDADRRALAVTRWVAVVKLRSAEK